ncbi:MAG TPA: UDP-N-acetylmuramoyl-tripeptide--D-alanyl-D-alanine ligase [Casimicrobiaceae bacterium]|nr:UDP-N-acetylmuramoyl-tripeptide--D-alanyl-D-alanine ligase [Casimicrobiaceae bacterium]
MMDTGAAARAVSGRLVGAPVMFSRVTTDTRRIVPGDLFVALRGERFDGHDFVAQAFAGGAAAALVARDRAASLAGNLIAVDEPLTALGTLAAHWRSRFDIPVAVVVGSNGKTTTKAMIASVFRAGAGADAVAVTPGNFNNAIGLPLAVLGMRPQHRLAVFEIGMNHRGETLELAAIAQPTICVITNVQREHQEFLRSVDEVAFEHADAVAALPAGGTAVVNADDPRARIWRDAAKRAGAGVVDFALDHPAAVTATCAAHDPGSVLEIATAAGSARVLLHVPGRHMAANALAAVATGLAAGLPLPVIAQGLEAFRPVAGRLAARAGIHGATVIDDSYNANPDSMRAAIDVLASRPGVRWLAMGDMGEIGGQGPEFHREIGTYARAAGIERMFACGPLAAEAVRAFGAGASHHASAEVVAGEVVAALADRAQMRGTQGARAGITVLVKGSRFMRMEQAVAALTGATPEGVH